MRPRERVAVNSQLRTSGRALSIIVCVAGVVFGCRYIRRTVSDDQIKRDLIGRKVQLPLGLASPVLWTVEPDEIKAFQVVRRVTDRSAGTDVIYASVQLEGADERVAGTMKVIYSLSASGWRFDQVLPESVFTFSGSGFGNRSRIAVDRGVYIGPPILRVGLLTRSGVMADELALALRHRGFPVEEAVSIRGAMGKRKSWPILLTTILVCQPMESCSF
jgi:hypothetical protein